MSKVEQIVNNDYDAEPVRYCAKCFSLKICYKEVLDSDCCMDCGSLDIRESSIDTWEALYVRRYGKKYLEKGTDPKKSPIFSLPINKLKDKVANAASWKTIIETIYHKIPKGFTKGDALIWFFDKLTQDNKFEALRLLLVKMKL